MHAILIGIAGWMMAGIVSRVLIGAGLAAASYVGISAALNAALDQIAVTWSTLGSAGAILAIAGLGSFVSIVGSALITSLSFAAARFILVRN